MADFTPWDYDYNINGGFLIVVPDLRSLLKNSANPPHRKVIIPKAESYFSLHIV